MPARVLIAIVLLAAAGCASVVPGYSFGGSRMTQEERNRREGDRYLVFYWDEVPEDPPAWPGPLALLANVTASVLLFPVHAILHGLGEEEAEDEAPLAPPRREIGPDGITARCTVRIEREKRCFCPRH